MGLTVLGVLTVIIAAGPSWYRQPSPFAEDSTPLVIVLDVSSSMQQTDVAPNRLFMAKQKIIQLLQQRSSGKVSLVVFSGSAHLAMPPTLDREVFHSLLAAIQPQIMPREGKFVEYTLPLIDAELNKSSTSGSVILMTDGISTAGLNHFQRYFSTNQHQLLIWGIGRSHADSTVPLEREKLSALAEKVGGQWTPFTIEHRDVDAIASLLEQHAKFNGGESEPWYDWGYHLLFPLMLLYLLWFRRGWLVQWGLVVVICSSVYSPYSYASFGEVTSQAWLNLWFSKDQQGQRLFRQQHYEQAARVFEDSYWKAIAFYYAADYPSAQQYFLRIDNVDAQLGAAAALAHQREYIAARSLYQQILTREPANVVALHNLDLMVSIIEHINDFSEGQLSSGEMESSQELGQQPQTAEGVTQEVDPSLLIEETLSAKELLSNKQAHEKWMKRVDSDLGVFLGYKFHRQLELGSATKTLTESAND
ncbi:VWA domain-containing protein [Vibrio nomapromontoriensis]|uniref:VWA domain-containing protein n=1 Tax=Vibrio nomapromontoriensis TaxID=2910246 RepID=UPI003D0B84A9